MTRNAPKTRPMAWRAWAICVAAGAGLGAVWACSPGTLAVGALAVASGWWLARRLPQHERRFVISIYVAGLLLRVVVSLGMDATAWVLQGANPFGVTQEARTGAWAARDTSRAFIGAGDSDFYSERGFQMVQFVNGVRTPRTLASIHQQYGWNGYLYVVGLFHYLFGYSPVSVKLINAWLGALVGPLLYLLVRPWVTTAVARWACGVTAFVPSLVIWSATNLKDIPFVVLTLAVLLVFEAIRREAPRVRWRHVALLAVLLGAHVTLRSAVYSALLVGAYALSWALTSRWRMRWKAALLAGIGVGAVLLREKLLAFVALAIIYHGGHALTPGISYHYLPERFYFHPSLDMLLAPGMIDLWTLLSMGKAVWHYLLEPLPWRATTASSLLAYPQMVCWYLLLIPAAYGFLQALRRQVRFVLPLGLTVAAWVFVAAITSGNIGSVFRQRDMITPLVIFFACFGIHHLTAQRERAA